MPVKKRQVVGKAAKPKRAEKKRALTVSFRKKTDIEKNYLKHLRHHMDRVCKDRGFAPTHLYFMLYIYDLEFFTIRYVAENFGGGMTEPYVVRELIKPLERAKYITVVMNQGRLNNEESQMFGLGHQLKKFALSQAGKNFIQRFYRELESGKMSIAKGE